MSEEQRQEELPLVVAVDLGGTQIRAAVLRGARLLARVGLLTGENPTPERVIPRMFSAVDQVVAAAGMRIKDAAGIGIAAPGPLDSRTGIVYSPPNLPGWNEVPLRDLFFDRYAVPVHVENDANACAIGEYLFGAGRGVSNMVYLTISTGIGGGVIVDDSIVEGASGTAGEIGHMTIDRHGDRCNCGNIGCLERIASGANIARRANEAIAEGRGQDLLDFVLAHPELHEQPQSIAANTPADSAAHTPIHVNARTVAIAAQQGVPLARHIINDAAEAIGVGLVNVIHIFNPALIILGGGMTQMGQQIMGPAQRIIDERAMRAPREAVKIVLAELGPDVGLIGAGALTYYYERTSVTGNDPWPHKRKSV